MNPLQKLELGTIYDRSAYAERVMTLSTDPLLILFALSLLNQSVFSAKEKFSDSSIQIATESGRDYARRIHPITMRLHEAEDGDPREFQRIDEHLQLSSHPEIRCFQILHLKYLAQCLALKVDEALKFCDFSVSQLTFGDNPIISDSTLEKIKLKAMITAQHDAKLIQTTEIQGAILTFLDNLFWLNRKIVHFSPENTGPVRLY